MKVEYDFENLTHTLAIEPKNKVEEQELREFFEAKGECKLEYKRDYGDRLDELYITRVT